MTLAALTMETVNSPNAQQSACSDTRSSAPLVELLSRPGSYPERTSGVSLVETHISWVFLTD
ncbi:MAG TPA: hypothetical protein VFI31_21445, partial [Pirellulales bacterium]|nr:hypothetical protein [Pirellulales bacterium]